MRVRAQSRRRRIGECPGVARNDLDHAGRRLSHGLLLAAGIGVCACGSTVSTSRGQALASPASTPSPIATSPATTPTTTPVPIASPTSTPVSTATPHVSRAHAVLSACRLVDAQTASTAAGTVLAKDQDLSSFVGTIAGGPPTYVQDDCAYSSSSGGATIRVVLVEPSAGGGTRAQGQSAYTFVQEDLEANGGATLTRVDGLGDAAAMWLQAGDSFAERIVLDHEIVFSIGVENAADPEAVVRAVATAALTRADSGRADGRPGS